MPEEITEIQEALSSIRMLGVIRKLVTEKGYGFIEGEDQRDYFLHWSAVEKVSIPFRNIKLEDRVEFNFKEGARGPVAMKVKVIRNSFPEV